MEQFRECGKSGSQKEVEGLFFLAIINKFNNHQRVLRVLQPLDESRINKSHITLIERRLI